MSIRWKKIVAEFARDVIAPENMTRGSAPFLTEDIGPGEFIQALENAGRLLDAAKVLAYALPRREAVWWGCMSTREMEGVLSDKPQQVALAAAEKWVFEPTDEHRTSAFLAVQKCKSNSGGSLCALAAAFSGESLPLGDNQKLDVDISTFPELVFAAVFLAADEGKDDLLNERLRDYLAIGQDIACGGSGKKEAPAE